MTTDSYCVCTMAGFCEKHLCDKTPRDVELCQGINVSTSNRDSYRRGWDEGRLHAQRESSYNKPPQTAVESQHQSPREIHNIDTPVVNQITPEKVPCEYRGKLVREQGCTVCGTRSRKTRVYQCSYKDNKVCTMSHLIHGVKCCQRCPVGAEVFEDAFTEALIENKKAKKKRVEETKKKTLQKIEHKRSNSWMKAFQYGTYERNRVEFITLKEFSNDIHRLASMVPSDVIAVAGVARSGLYPATLISMLNHLPLYIIRQATNDVIHSSADTYTDGDLISAGNGWRLEGSKPINKQGKILIVDDTVMTGNSFKTITNLVKEHFPNHITASVYANPKAVKKPDIHAATLGWPHLLEWNIFNSVILPSMAIDFDGILCNDCPPGHDDDGPKYKRFLAETMPKYLIRKAAVPLIVTARLEKYRPETEKWLKKWGIKWNKLVMAPWETLRERQAQDMGKFKGEHYKKFASSCKGIKPCVFVESDIHQAPGIAKHSKQLVICPAAGKVFKG